MKFEIRHYEWVRRVARLYESRNRRHCRAIILDPYYYIIPGIFFGILILHIISGLFLVVVVVEC